MGTLKLLIGYNTCLNELFSGLYELYSSMSREEHDNASANNSSYSIFLSLISSSIIMLSIMLSNELFPSHLQLVS